MVVTGTNLFWGRKDDPAVEADDHLRAVAKAEEALKALAACRAETAEATDDRRARMAIPERESLVVP